MNVARVYKRLFPFVPPGAVDLTGSGKDAGEIGFGPPPKFTCPPGAAPPVNPTSATGWRPVIASLSYSTLGAQTPHRVRIEFFETIIDEAHFEDGTVFSGVRWRQVLLDDPAVSFVYLNAIPVPVSEENGNPFGMRIVTEGRAEPSLAIIDWEWARFSLDVTEDLLWRMHGSPQPVYDVRQGRK